eukprot:g12458.t1
MTRASSIKKVPEGVRQFLGDDMLRSVLAKVQVPCMTYETLVTVYGVGSLDILKIDTEGFDHEILRAVLALGYSRHLWPWQVQFEKNMLSDWRTLDEQVIKLQDAGPELDLRRCRFLSWKKSLRFSNRLATETIPLESVHAESGSQQAANAWENTTSREIKEAPIPASVSELEGMETEVTTQDIS